MSILSLVLAIVVVGVLLWMVNAYIPMDATIRRILNLVVITCLIIWLLKVFGLWQHLASVHI